MYTAVYICLTHINNVYTLLANLLVPNLQCETNIDSVVYILLVFMYLMLHFDVLQSERYS